MLRVTVELLPGGWEEPELLGTLLIANDGTGDRSTGNYIVKTFSKRAKEKVGFRLWHSDTHTRVATVLKHPRLRKPVWNLVAKALKELDYA